MKLYLIDMRLHATAYIKAKSAAEALTIAEGLRHQYMEVKLTAGDVPISKLRYDDPNLPDVSLSPAMIIHGPDADARIKRADD